MRKKRLVWNTFASLINQLVVAVCGLILPRAILEAFGSELNGLVFSISQFLGMIAFLELGVGAVVQSSLYKPLADKDDNELSKIMVSAKRFFRNIALIFTVYIVVITIFYPVIVDSNFSWAFSAVLIIILSVNSLAEYYFGIVNQLLLNADQRAYVQLTLQSIIQILNVIFCVILIKLGFSIHIVKLATATIFMVRPLCQWHYINKNYNIDYTIKLTGEPIKQKWNGLAQHIAAVVLDKTDAVVLTMFATLSDLSIYSVYYLVVNNLRRLIQSTTIGIQSLFGNMVANGEEDKLNETFDLVEISTHLAVTFIFTCCQCLLVPFVSVYTKGITDTNYNVPVFAVLICLANALYSFRNSYNMLIKAAGHYKQTQNSAIIEVVINVVISLALVIKWGLIGVAVGTLVAMAYRTLYFVFYLKTNIIHRPMRIFIKNICLDAIIALITVALVNLVKLDVNNYLEWVILAGIVAVICGFICLVFNWFIYKDRLFKAMKYFRRK